MRCAPYAAIPMYDGMNEIVGWAIVDQDDYAWLSEYRWNRHQDGYAHRWIDTSDGPRTVAMHRQILGLTAGDGLQGDHLNYVRFDNRRVNLRAVTAGENKAHRRFKPKTRSGYRGVSWIPDRNRWRAQIRINNRKIHVGYFTDVDEAGAAVKAIRERHGLTT